MSGQCYGCGSGFSLFKKEHGCKNCGFAFCSNCLTKKIVLPKLDNAKHHVCNKCFDILSGKSVAKDSQKYSPPEAFKKRVAALKEREAHGNKATVKSSQPHHSKYAGLPKPDRDIAERLEKLKEHPKEQQVTDEELRQRLTKLKGQSSSTASSKEFYQAPDRRTQVEQVDDLLDEITSEVEIDSHRVDPVQYVEDRLARLHKEESGAAQDEQNNLDRNDKTPKKTFVKNIDVEPLSSKKTVTWARLSEEDGGLNFEEVHVLMSKTAEQMEADAQQALEGMKQDQQLREQLERIQKSRKERGEDGSNIAGEQQSLESNIDNAEVDEDSDDEEAAVKHLVKQFTEEAKLDEKVGNLIANTPQATSNSKKDPRRRKNRQEEDSKQNSEEDSYEDPDELPYCCICNEDAVIRCRDCDMDLYCTHCFRDGHKELGLMDHCSIPYKPPKGYR